MQRNQELKNGKYRMNISIVSLFPAALEGYSNSSMVAKAQRLGKLQLDLVDPRRWAGSESRSG